MSLAPDLTHSPALAADLASAAERLRASTVAVLVGDHLTGARDPRRDLALRQEPSSTHR